MIRALRGPNGLSFVCFRAGRTRSRVSNWMKTGRRERLAELTGGAQRHQCKSSDESEIREADTREGMIRRRGETRASRGKKAAWDRNSDLYHIRQNKRKKRRLKSQWERARPRERKQAREPHNSSIQCKTGKATTSSKKLDYTGSDTHQNCSKAS